MTLLPTLKLRLAQPAELIDLAAIPDLVGVHQEGDVVKVGAMTCHDEVARSATVREAIPALSALAGSIGDPQVRNRGTLGGSIANNDPAADYPAALVGLGATVETNQRQIAADDFFTGMFETALEPGELITGVTFPIPCASRLCQVRQSRVPLCHRWRAGRRDGWHGARGRDRGGFNGVQTC